jgi:CheY-like chemotaxis protein
MSYIGARCPPADRTRCGGYAQPDVVRAVDGLQCIVPSPFSCSCPGRDPGNGPLRCLPRTALFKIYLVEDSPVIRENLIATLEELLPVEVVGMAEDEATAVRWLSDTRHAVDLVIVDIFLRGGSGIGVLKAAQAIPHRHRLVVLSNQATPYVRHECLSLGADRVFDKSNDIDTLIDYCAQLVEGNNPGSDPAAGP